MIAVARTLQIGEKEKAAEADGEDDDSDDGDEMPHLSDSDDEENIPNVPTQFLSGHQRQRREIRLNRERYAVRRHERAERIHVCS